MFSEIFRFELRQQLKGPLFWLIALGLAGLAFAAASSDSVTIGGGVGNIHRNAPFVVVQVLGLFSVIGLFLITVFVAGAALRDFSAGTAEMMFATPMSRHAYLGGRFAAGWLTSVLVMVAVAVGCWLGSLMPWLDPARLGPTPWHAYGWGLAVLVLPNLFFIATLLLLLAALTRSMLATYIGVIAFFVLWQIALVTLGHGNLDHQLAGALVDPFGLGALDLATRYWTPDDRNLRVPGFTGVMLANRALWIGVGAALLGATLLLFKPGREGLRLWRRRARTDAPTAPLAAAVISTPLPRVALQDGVAARLRQLHALAAFDARNVLRGVPFLAMLAFGLMNLGGRLAFADQMFGTSLWPVTHLMTQAMDESYKWLLIIILGFYAGELVWRERDGRISGVIDAFPTPDWIALVSKLAALAAVIVAYLGAGIVVSVGYQLAQGFHVLQPLLYAEYVGFSLLTLLPFALLAVALQVWANSKFGGYALLLAWMVATIALGQFHLSDHLYRYGSAPEAPWSDMNGWGSFWIGALWFHAYWFAFALAIAVTAALFWPRGNAAGWRARTRIARQRLGLPARLTLAGALAVFALIGVFAFHNTHGLYRYQTHDDDQRLAADYEKAYRKYLGLAQPRISAVEVKVDIHPQRRQVDIDGHYTLVNRHAEPIDTLLVQLPIAQTRAFDAELDFPAHSVVLADAAQGFHLYRLAEPLAPGARMDFRFRQHVAYPGFANEPTGEQIVHNGTFFDSFAFPHFCYDASRELKDANDRRKYGLGPQTRLPPPTDAAAHANNLISCDADWVHFAATLSTATDQIALAPGYLEKTWEAGGRRYFRYVQDTPILDFFSFQSARYEVARDAWQDVKLEVYHDHQHPWNVERMLDAVKHSLDYYTRHFGPYQFRQLRIVEFPGYRSFAQSFANTVPFSEDIGFIADLRKASDIDYVTYVTAHEVAHQWWAHQAIGARVAGVTLLDETLAQYSALMVMKRLYGPTKMRKFLKYELDRYLSGRAGEVAAEEPLALVQPDQAYIHYRKGSVIFYALADYLGEDKVNAALRGWLDKVKFQQPPYTDSRELVAALRAVAGPDQQEMLTDWLERITLYDNRMLEASAKALPDGRWEVTMKVHAARLHADGKGRETPAKGLGIPLEIGVFAQAASGEEEDEKPLYLAKMPVADGDSTLTVIVDGKPWQAGIDPFNELVDRVSDDNRAQVAIK